MQSNDGKNGEKKSGNTDIDGEDNWIATEISEVIANEGLDREVEDEEWLPDKEKARRKREQARQYQSAVSTGDRDIDAKRQQESIGNANDAASGADTDTYPSGERGKKSSAYTEEEEEIIRSMGGTRKKASKREQGYLGDSTLQEIAADYQVPVCYLADVLCMWGVPIPINTSDRLGDLVTGEVRPGSSSIFMFCTRRNLTSYSTIVFFQNQTPQQAFAILEAVNTLDVSALHDRYSNTPIINLCSDWDIDITVAFEMAMKEGWSLPFGVHSVLRVEQEEELLRVLGGLYYND